MKGTFYACDICGNMVAMVLNGNGKMICCGKEMHLMEANVTDGNVKTHKPVLKNVGGNQAIAIGEDAHPMSPEHYIQWVAVETSESLAMYPLAATDQPEKVVENIGKEGVIYAYCNLHGLWSNKL